MDAAFLLWIAVLVVGAVCGIFMRLRTVGLHLVVWVGLCLAGFLVSAIVASQGAALGFGLALVALPLVGGIFFVGALLSNALVAVVRRSSRARRP